MPGLRDALARFRLSGTPGTASAVGVPADRRAGVEAELEPVFAALANVLGECADIRARATVASRREVDQASARVSALIAQARGAVPGERAAALSTAKRQAEGELAETVARAARQVDEVAQYADARMPQLVAEVVDRVRHAVASLGAGDHAEKRANERAGP